MSPSPEPDAHPLVPHGRSRGWWVTFLAVVFALPLLIGWWILGRAPALPPHSAAHRLQDGSLIWVALDAESTTAFSNPEIWPASRALAVRSLEEVPARIRNGGVLLVCSGGVKSAFAARRLAGLGVPGVHYLAGGAQAWISERNDPATFRASPRLEQWAAILSFFGVKTLYSLLALGLVLLLWRETAPDLAALRWSMLAFSAGEACCFVNVMVFHDRSYLLEHLHSAGMVVSAALAVFALLKGLDDRVLHIFGEAPCGLRGLCAVCDKRGRTECGVPRVFLYVILAGAICATLPWFAPFQPTAYPTRILGFLHAYRHPLIHQLYELRVLPGLALGLFAGAFIALRWVDRKDMTTSQILFSAGIGAMAFSCFRMTLVAVFHENQVWFAFWEELSELVFILMIAGILWIFRRGLLPRWTLSPAKDAQ